MSEINIEAIEALRKLQEKQIPNPQEKYQLYEDKSFHRVAYPSYKQGMEADKCRFSRPRQDKEILEQIKADYNWKDDEFEPYKTQLEYYENILSIVCLEKIEVDENFSTMEADRMIRDFFICTFY
jgi:hypothetical protein